MRRMVTLLVVAGILGATIFPEPSAARRRRPRKGVFGTINGKNFKASNISGADDPCVNGIYRPNEGILVLGAIECGRKRRRQGVAVRRNYKVLVLACSKFASNVNSLVPPYEIPCPSSGYSEYRTGRFRQPVSMATWMSNFAFLEDFTLTSNLRLRIDSFDGSNVRGALFGVFEVPGEGATGPAPISGEVRIDFPFRIQ